MLLIRTSEAMELALESPLPNDLKDLLRGHVEQLAEYEEYTMEELAEFLIVDAGDALSDVESAYGQQLVDGGEFTFTVEYITEHGGWYEVIWIISDDGFGLALFIEIHPETDPALLAACRHAIADAA